MSSANEVQVIWAEEATYGTVDAAATPQVMRLTSESLMADPSYIRSEEVRSDRQVTDVIRSDYSVSGALNINLSYLAHDAMMRRALLADADWTAATPLTATDISAAAADNSLNSGAGAFVSSGFAAGMWISVSGFTGASTTANTIMKIVSVTTTKMIVTGVTLINDAAGESVTITSASWVKNGTTKKSYSIRRLAGEDTLYEYFTGIMLDSMSLAVNVGEKISGSFGCIGKDNAYGNWTNANSPTAATTGRVFQTVDHVPALYEDFTSMRFTEFTLELKNNLRARKEVGYLGAQSIGSGTCSVTGTLKAYFKSTTQLAKVRSDTSTSLQLRLRNASNQNYFIDLPSVKLTKGASPMSGPDTDLMAEFSWEAFMDSTLGYTMAIQRFASLA